VRKSDTGIFVVRPCEVCGERVLISDNSGYWSVDPKTLEVTAWHMRCRPVFRYQTLEER
jgi:hypothetical protein